MKKVLLILAVVAASASAQGAQSQPAQSKQAQPEAQRWEYAMYDEMKISTYFYRWIAGNTYKSAGTLNEVLADMGCPNKKDYAVRTMLFDCVGRQGWQLVGTSNATLFSGPAPIEFYFKRPVK